MYRNSDVSEKFSFSVLFFVFIEKYQVVFIKHKYGFIFSFLRFLKMYLTVIEVFVLTIYMYNQYVGAPYPANSLLINIFMCDLKQLSLALYGIATSKHDVG